MKDFTRICKVLKLGRCSRAIDFVEKWESETQKPREVSKEVGNNQEDSVPMTQANDDDDIITFNNRPRDHSSLDDDEVYKQQWYVQNSQYLCSVVQKGVNELVKKVDSMICAQNSGSKDIQEVEEQILEFNLSMMKC